MFSQLIRLLYNIYKVTRNYLFLRQKAPNNLRQDTPLPNCKVGLFRINAAIVDSYFLPSQVMISFGKQKTNTKR